MPTPDYVDALAPVIPRHDHHKLHSHSKITQTSTCYLQIGDISKQPRVKEVMRKRIKQRLVDKSCLTEHEGSWLYW